MDWLTVEIRDENGKGFDTVQYEDVVLPKQFMHTQPETRLKAISELKYKDGDILICSYPKTGTHWVFNLIHFMMNPGPVDDMLAVSPKLVDLHPLEDIEDLQSPRVVISHLKPNRLPVEHLQKRGKIILITRNPRDTMVSHMYHTQRFDVFNCGELSWNCFFDNWIKGQIPTGSYFDYYNSWQKELTEPDRNRNVLLIRYENLIKDGLAEMKKIQLFLDVSNTDDRLQQILERCSWRRLKVDIHGENIATEDDQEGDSHVSRKGVIGHWRNKFTVAQDQIFDKVIEEQFKDSMFNVSM